MDKTYVDRQRPESSEFMPFYAGYIGKVPSIGVYNFFKSQLPRLSDMLNTVAKDYEDYTYAEGKWTIKQVIRHIADSERVFAYRMLCISRGETGSLPGFDQDAYAVDTKVDHLTLSQLMDELLATRASTAALVDNLSVSDLRRMGTASGGPVSVRALFFMLTGHMEHHIQLFEERYLPNIV